MSAARHSSTLVDVTPSPLRKIIERRQYKDTDLWQDVLECGHVVNEVRRSTLLLTLFWRFRLSVEHSPSQPQSMARASFTTQRSAFQASTTATATTPRGEQ